MLKFLSVQGESIIGFSTRHFEGCAEVETDVEINFSDEVDYVLRDGKVIEVPNEDFLIRSEKSSKLLELESTDWMIIRHYEQLSLNKPTSLTEQEFNELTDRRQSVRDSI